LVPNNPAEVLRREMFHLRIVSDYLWDTANAAIDARQNHQPPLAGPDHPLARIPRNSRGPLSEIFFCGACLTGKMYMEGREEGGYRCSRAHKGECWNSSSRPRRPACSCSCPNGSIRWSSTS
jgi:hypothetical protein